MVPPSRKKKYGRDHLASFYVIFLLKSALNLVDISETIAYFNKWEQPQAMFDMFCGEIEEALELAFTNGAAVSGALKRKNETGRDRDEVARTIALAFAYTLMARLHTTEERAREISAT
jgi:hypothetical protein